MNKHRLYRRTSVVLALSLALLSACNPIGTESEMPLATTGSMPVLGATAPESPTPRPTPLAAPQPLPIYFAELEAEYAGFSTLALTASYLERKIRTLIASHDGEGLRREIDFARYKHPQLLIDIMLANPELYVAAAAMPEVIAFRAVNPLFDEYMEQLSGAQSEPLEISFLYSESRGWGAVAMAEATGRSVAVYQNLFSTDMYLQCYNNQGMADGAAVQLAESELSGIPSVAMDANGSFVVVWGNATGIFAQHYNNSCQSQGDPFQINSLTGNHSLPTVAMAPDGKFTVAWQTYQVITPRPPEINYDILVRRYQANGDPLGPETSVASNQMAGSYTDIAMNANGNFVVSWQNNSQDGSGNGILARRYASSGVAQGSVFQVNTYTNNDQSLPVVGMDAAGNFVIAWQSQGQDGDGWGIYAQRYSHTGTAQGSEFRVSHVTTGNQSRPSIAMAAQGDFLITWLNPSTIFPSLSNLFLQHYNASGDIQTPAFQVSGLSGPEFIQSAFTRSVALDAQGRFILIWGPVPAV